MTYTEKDLIEELQRVSDKYCNGEPPTTKEIKKYGNISLNTYNRIYGGIVKARKKTDFEKVDLRKKDNKIFSYGLYTKMTPSIRKRIRERDGGCRICLNQNYIEIHHITPIQYWNIEEEHEKMNHPRNLICLCRSCHQKLEGKFKGRNHGEFEDLAKDYLDMEEDREPQSKGLFDY